MGAIQVNQKVFEQMKQAYSEIYGSSPSSLIDKLDKTYKNEIHQAKDGSGNLISDKTIRNFFKTSTPPKTQEKNLNYLCKVLLEYDSYQEALRQLGQVDAEVQGDWLTPYWEHIQRKCGTMQVLDMTQPVQLDNIYIEVSILEKRRKQRTIDELLAALDDEEINSNRIPPISKERLTGLEAIKLYRNLLILGLPGSGKTTFSKHLALHFSGDELIEPSVPVYIELKDFVENEDTPNLIDTVKQEFTERIPDAEPKVQRLLEQGQCVILLDGLDEVRVADTKGVTRNIDEFVKLYPKNRFVITSRIAASDYVFPGFTVLEMADFGEEQVAQFVDKWFKDRQKPEDAKKFLDKLRDNPSIRQLTTNPLLLTLLCWLFDQGYNLAKNRHSLYDDAVDVLLERWDATRKIQRNQIYQEKLTRRRKINLLSKIAYYAFTLEEKRQFLQQALLEDLISDFIKNIPGVEPETLELDSKAVLKAIESNHGLLVEQAFRRYSFSHLTFQEYFIAQYVVDNRDTELPALIEQHLIDRKWREVFLIVAGKLPKIDDFLKIMFSHAQLLVQSEALQRMLSWLDRITTSSEVKSSSWRAFYLAVALDIELYINRQIKIDRNLAQKVSLELREYNKKGGKIIQRTPKCKLELYLAIILAIAHDYASSRSSDIKGTSEFTQERIGFEEDPGIGSKLGITIAIAREIGGTDLAEKLTSLQGRLPLDDASESEWQGWAEDLRAVMIQHLDVGHNITFSEEDAKALENYLYVNKLLLECTLGGDSYSSTDVREQIIDRLLLPSARIAPDLSPSLYNEKKAPD